MTEEVFCTLRDKLHELGLEDISDEIADFENFNKLFTREKSIIFSLFEQSERIRSDLGLFHHRDFERLFKVVVACFDLLFSRVRYDGMNKKFLRYVPEEEIRIDGLQSDLYWTANKSIQYLLKGDNFIINPGEKPSGSDLSFCFESIINTELIHKLKAKRKEVLKCCSLIMFLAAVSQIMLPVDDKKFNNIVEGELKAISTWKKPNLKVV